MSEENNLVGRKVRGFRFKNSKKLSGSYTTYMDNFLGEAGTITAVGDHEVWVKFESSTNDWVYPLEEAKKHLVDEEKDNKSPNSQDLFRFSFRRGSNLNPTNDGYPKLMYVSDNSEEEALENGIKRVVFQKKRGVYSAWSQVESLEEAKDASCALQWRYAVDIPETVKDQDLVGKKMRGFKFTKSNPGYNKSMDDHIGQIGKITEADDNGIVTVAFEDKTWFYPLEEVRNHLVDDTEQFSKKETISFGNYMLSEERAKSINSVNLNHVTDADFENWLHQKSGQEITERITGLAIATPYSIDSIEKFRQLSGLEIVDVEEILTSFSENGVSNLEDVNILIELGHIDTNS